MKYCTHCNAPMDDNARFCHICGGSCDNNRDIAEEKEFLDATLRFLKYERIAWKVTAIVFLVIACIYGFIGVVFGLMFGAAGSALDVEEIGVVALFTYIVVAAIVFLPVSIVSFKAASRIDWYMERIYDDPASVLDRTGSIGMIVFTALFNEIALIFVIINFARTKGNAVIVKRIRDRQKGLIQ